MALPRNFAAVKADQQLADQKRRNAASDATAAEDPGAAALFARAKAAKEARAARRGQSPTSPANPNRRVQLPHRMKPVEAPKAGGVNEDANVKVKPPKTTTKEK